MKFKLCQKSAGRSGPSGLATFNVTDEKGAVRGTISIPSSEAGDLIASWKGAYVAAPKPGPSAMAKTLMEKRRHESPAQSPRPCFVVPEVYGRIRSLGGDSDGRPARTRFSHDGSPELWPKRNK